MKVFVSALVFSGLALSCSDGSGGGGGGEPPRTLTPKPSESPAPTASDTSANMPDIKILTITELLEKINATTFVPSTKTEIELGQALQEVVKIESFNGAATLEKHIGLSMRQVSLSSQGTCNFTGNLGGTYLQLGALLLNGSRREWNSDGLLAEEVRDDFSLKKIENTYSFATLSWENIDHDERRKEDIKNHLGMSDSILVQGVEETTAKAKEKPTYTNCVRVYDMTKKSLSSACSHWSNTFGSASRLDIVWHETFHADAYTITKTTNYQEGNSQYFSQLPETIEELKQVSTMSASFHVKKAATTKDAATDFSGVFEVKPTSSYTPDCVITSAPQS